MLDLLGFSIVRRYSNGKPCDFFLSFILFTGVDTVYVKKSKRIISMHYYQQWEMQSTIASSFGGHYKKKKIKLSLTSCSVSVSVVL